MFGRILKWLGAALGVLVIAGLVFSVFATRNSFPRTDGELSVAGLEGEARVVRDERGVPHIYADSEHDLYLAQGFVHAQDRFWQMDFWRHIGQARLSEMFGESQVDTDAFLRTLGFNDIGLAELEEMPAEDVAVLEAYAEGVNAYLAGRSGSELSLEHLLVGLLYGYEPEPWEPIHTIAWARMMGWELRANIDEEIARVITANDVGVDRAEELYPPMADDKTPIIRGMPDGVAFEPATLAVIGPALEDLADDLGRVDALLGGSFEGIGSNNWVVSGELTDTGLPYLADDPHLGIQMPSIWYQNAIHCDACDLHVTGFSFAGVPGVVLGHNEDIAWGVTNFPADSMDLVVERLDPEDPGRYEARGAFVPFETKTEVIEVAGGDPIEIEVRRTRHGPVVSDTMGAMSAVGPDIPGLNGNADDEYVVALQWTTLEPSTLVQAMLGINRASNWDEFREALALWDIAQQNFVFADREGNIGYSATGTIPVRAVGNGRWPVPGWDDSSVWVDFVPPAELPHVLNPADGIIASANQRPLPVGVGPWIGSDFAYGYRGQRIYDLLDALEPPITRDEVAAIQLDARNVSAEELIPAFLAVDSDDERVAEVQRLFEEWASLPEAEAYQQGVDSPHAAIYNLVWRDLVIRTIEDETIPRTDFTSDDYSATSRFFTFFRTLVERPDDEWWDDKTTDEVESRDDILEASMIAGWEDTTDQLGDDPEDWAWGDLHVADFRNQSLGESGIAPVEAIFNRGGIRTAGGKSIVNATGWNVHAGPAVNWLPSFRMVLDLADWDSSIGIHTTGQSGHAFHRHYFDMAQPWADGDYHPMPWTDPAVEAASADTLLLVPEG